MSFSPAALTPADHQALLARFEAALTALGGPSTVPAPATLLNHALGRKEEAPAVDPKPAARAFSTLANPVSRHLFWRLLASQMKMGIPLYDALEQMKNHDFHAAFPEDLHDLVSTWQADMESDTAKPYDFFLRHVAPLDFPQGLRMWLGSQTTGVGHAIDQEAESPAHRQAQGAKSMIGP